MRVEISGGGIRVPQHLHADIERRLRFALGRFVDRIGRVKVRLENVNGLRGAIDKACTIAVGLVGLESVVAKDVDINIASAVDRTAGLAARCVRRALERERSRWAGELTGSTPKRKSGRCP